MATITPTLVNRSNTHAILTWESNSPTATIERDSVVIAIDQPPPFHDTGLLPDTTYTYKITTATDSGTFTITTTAVVTSVYVSNGTSWIPVPSTVFGIEAYVPHNDQWIGLT